MTGIKHFILILAGFLPLCLFAQQDTADINLLSTSQLRSFGRNAMIQGDYISAAIYLEKFMDRKPTHATGALWLGESFMKSREYDLAYHWYERAFKLSEETQPLAVFNQAVLLKMAGKCDEAAEKFARYKKLASRDKNAMENRRQMKMELAGCDSLVGQPAVSKTSVARLDTTINFSHIENSPLYLNDSIILYASMRTNETSYMVEGDTTGAPVRKFHLAEKIDGQWVYKSEFPGDFAQPGENLSSAALSPDGKRLFLSKCRMNWKGRMECKLYYSERSGDNFGSPIELPKPVNIPGYSSTQPAPGITSKDQQILYFVSDRKDGKGGTDIWYTIWDERRQIYKTPRNAGAKVNSKKDELSPWYDQEYRTLYYSSEGRPGIGGFDIYRSIGEYSRFTVGENLREPINSGQDETFYKLSPDRKHAMLSSNRRDPAKKSNNSCCDDLFEVTRLEFVNLMIVGKVLDQEDSLEMIPIKQSLVKLQLVDPLTGEATFLKTVPVDENGMYSIPVEAGNIYRISGSAEGYLSSSVTLNTTEVKSSGVIERDIPLNKVADKSFALANVYYETDKYDLTAGSKTVLDTTLLVLLQENPEIKIEIGAHTDDVGSDAYNQNLSQKRAEGVVKYLISKGITSNRLVAKGYGETQPRVPNLKPDGSPDPVNRQKNRRTEFRIVGKVKVKVVDYDE